MSSPVIDEEEPSATQTGPKGVINDWRKFKLESLDQDSLPPSKRELLRQMSSTHKPKEEGQDRGHRKVRLDMHNRQTRLTSFKS
ncbi:hypothetical protein SKAU_G00067150 [Synaphobranchus kaupii]|uniref:Phosducin domain-containing protein n=1 Tax=Synaphobranchus kaupii TaxID=118154 RepID=A0A9Q1G688_SYNKA|nr:hypothetical protein SKAU_G00067150 [Synaphobranchus kaupii]